MAFLITGFPVFLYISIVMCIENDCFVYTKNPDKLSQLAGMDIMVVDD